MKIGPRYIIMNLQNISGERKKSKSHKGLVEWFEAFQLET